MLHKTQPMPNDKRNENPSSAHTKACRVVYVDNDAVLQRINTQGEGKFKVKVFFVREEFVYFQLKLMSTDPNSYIGQDLLNSR